MPKEPHYALSKKITYILRHDPQSILIEMDDAGYVDKIDLCHKLGIDYVILKEIVQTNNKQRFEYSEDQTRIRACQGHSVKVDLGLKAQIPPDKLYHGTATRNKQGILVMGLQPQTRNHVHMSTSVHIAEDVALRHDDDISIAVIDTKEARHFGVEFYCSTNGIWLADHIPREAISFI